MIKSSTRTMKEITTEADVITVCLGLHHQEHAVLLEHGIVAQSTNHRSFDSIVSENSSEGPIILQ